MNMKLKTLVSLLFFLSIASVSVLALGGGGGKSPPEDDTVRVTMKPIQADDDVYGWIRITPDKFAVGANRLEPKNYYAVYLVSGEKREAVTDRPVRRSFGDGEFKFEMRLKEPFGGEWDKVVLYHRPNGEKDDTGEVAVLEGALE
jgi:hypothetical protein